jgi:hypothetical protein
MVERREPELLRPEHAETIDDLPFGIRAALEITQESLEFVFCHDGSCWGSTTAGNGLDALKIYLFLERETRNSFPPDPLA